MLKKERTTKNHKDPGTVIGLGLPPASSVLGDSLKLQALARLPDEKVNAFEEKWTAAIQAASAPAPASSRKKSKTWKVIAGIAVAAVVMVGIGISEFRFEVFQVQPRASLATQTTDANGLSAAYKGGREIVFTGDDCECGHINPQGAELTNLKSGDGAPTWQIQTEPEGAVIFTGSDSKISAALRELDDTGRDGRYLVLCTFRNDNQSEVVLERAFVVGNYSGDAPA
ncbi:hypothetical protein AGMMS49983_13430 [Clostridia bacterium]|nr:hypothetical protein AGMMS49983_13430 [Clostridia bacterium]